MADNRTWDQEDLWWKENFNSRPYAAGYTYEEFRPAYRYGFESGRHSLGRTWKDVEADLRTGWDKFEHRSARWIHLGQHQGCRPRCLASRHRPERPGRGEDERIQRDGAQLAERSEGTPSEAERCTRRARRNRRARSSVRSNATQACWTVELSHGLLVQLEQRGSGVLLQVLHGRRAGDREHDRRAMEQPRQRHLGRRGVRAARPPWPAGRPAPRGSPVASGNQGMKPMPSASQ